jgi:hypothetical protein
MPTGKNNWRRGGERRWSNWLGIGGGGGARMEVLEFF